MDLCIGIDCSVAQRWQLFFTLLIVNFSVLAVFRLRGNIQNNLMTYAAIPAKQWIRSAAIAVTVSAIAVFLMRFDVMRWSWVNTLSGQQSLLSAPIGTPSPEKTLIGPAIVIMALIALLLVMPSVVRAEESIFRRNLKSHSGNAKQAFLFGLSHLAMGLPIAGLVITGCLGFWYGHLHLQSNSSKIQENEHLACNTWIIGFSLTMLTSYYIIRFIRLIY